MSPAPAPAYAQVMEDMEKGKELAAQLQGLLRDSPEAGRFVDQILHTFSRAMRALDKAAVSAAGGEGSEVQSEVTCGGGASAGGKRKAPAADRKANCRRRTQQSSGNSVVVKNLDDGQAWRKYGQKEIQNSKHPKAYFRCTHKYDQLCTAQRQVQRCDDDPASYRVTYIGEHTCRDPATAPIIAAHVIHQVAAGDNDDGCGGLQAGSRLISFVAAPAAPVDAAAAPTTSTITTVTAPGPLLQPLKVEGGVGSSDQEEVLSSLTPGSSAARGGGGGGGVAGPFGPDQGDVTSSLHWSYDAVAGMEFFKNDEVVFDLDDIMGLSF